MKYSFAMKRDIPLLIRLTEDEKAAFDASAEISGITLSAWVRQQLRLAAIQELGRVGRKATFLKPIPLNTDGK
jgi:uncharacterized protein (DUF1778 family)